MQIVTDSGVDLLFPAEQIASLEIHRVPLVVSLGGKTYREGVDIQPEDFYHLLAASGDLPTTSQPSAGDFAEVYRRLAARDAEILSIHMSSGLSGTLNAAQAAAKMVPEARVTHVDTRTLSAASGWQVIAAARANLAGWGMAKILALLGRIGRASNSIYTLDDLKYLIHGGRISHMKGLIASLLNIKPLIGVETEGGTYVQMGQVRTFKRSLQGLADLIARKHPPGSALQVQVIHASNLEGAGMLREMLDHLFECSWLPVGQMSLVLGAHTGPSMVGVAFAPQEVFAEGPGKE
jgi:DegV family protein with EDD domain